MTGFVFTDGTDANDDFIMRQGDDAFLDITVKDRDTKAPVDVSSYPDAIWELEGVEFNIQKTLTGGQIQRLSSSVLRVALDDTDTVALRGLFTHQLRMIDSGGNKQIVLSGTGRFDAEVF